MQLVRGKLGLRPGRVSPEVCAQLPSGPQEKAFGECVKGAQQSGARQEATAEPRCHQAVQADNKKQGLCGVTQSAAAVERQGQEEPVR